MNIKITPPKDIKQLSVYLEKMNTQSTSHIGFCGEKNGEIHDSLMNDFSDLGIDDSFLVAYNETEIIGAIGLDLDLEDQYADVWGPFATNNDIELAQALWNEVLTKVPEAVKSFSFFINKNNLFVKEFLKKNNARFLGTDFVFSITRETIPDIDVIESKKFEEPYKKSFEELHSTAFPDTYFNASEILNRINEYNTLLLNENSDKEIKGYVYTETKPKYKEANIEYIAVYPNLRGEGVGKKLINDALHQIFSYPTIDEVDICVSSNNEEAIKLYKSAGFRDKYILDSYEID
ncbi:GNAT family N-acetyltransferase [Salinicoccus sp. CNSTN-B1]